MKEIIDSISSLGFIDSIQNKLRKGIASVNVKTLSGSLKPAAILALRTKLPQPYVIFCKDAEMANNWNHDLSLLLDEKDLVLLSKPKQIAQINDIHEDNLAWLINGLSKMINSTAPVVVTTPDILNLQIPNLGQLTDSGMTITASQHLNYKKFVESLALNGFDRCDYVSAQGEFAVRGGIIDIFPAGKENPFRVEFWGDEIESIREFNALSQRSIRELKSIEFISKNFHASNTVDNSEFSKYLNTKYILVFDSPEQLFNDENNLFSKYEELKDNHRCILINGLGRSGVAVRSQGQPNYNSSIKNFTERLRILSAKGFEIHLFAEGDIHLERFRELVSAALNDNDSDSDKDEYAEVTPASNAETLNSITWHGHTPTDGFILPDDKIAWIAEHQVFGRMRAKTGKSRNVKQGLTYKELKQLNPGDFVVHVDKGIGRFDGLETIELGSSKQDCMKIVFAEGDKLYVHMNYIHKVQKYSAREGIEPKLNKLGSAEWKRKKTRTKKKLKDIARELIKLYAERKMSPGYAFPADTIWQKEFEASFIYEDTPDQSKTTAEVKQDMTSETPMDRLVCGDVGFGKTEIAIRAAFKAVQAGKQVAVLAPTTILAQQHYMSFTDRLQRYPVITDVLSRFRKKKEQAEILEKLKTGGVDILIGTHRILSKDINFKDLGLLIIDEEQRFGVGAKEKLRQMRVAVDTLTLTATPIPRTLNFSLMGARDLSIIETPPRNRLPVQTDITLWNDDAIADAINKEVERGGQVFFVTDKVQDIEKICNNLKMMMPALRFGIAHGQMNTTELETAMEQFIERKTDVLVSTKIVESGLDIPNANTMLINRAQNFGLAELYQLRGRVGRTNIQAYCHLIIPPTKGIGQKSLQRLQAIEEYSDLGSGFQLALRDMEIRGAGNLLGPEQSGYILDLGFEMYQKVLDEVVRELKQDEFRDLFDDGSDKEFNFDNEEIAIEISQDALLPGDYVKRDTDRYEFYKRLYKVRSNAELDTIIEEIGDRFGKFPAEAENLFFVVKLRIAAIATGFTRIILKENRMIAEFPPKSNEEYYKEAFPLLMEYIQSLPDSRIAERNKKLYWEFGINSNEHAIEMAWKISRTIELV